MAKPEFDPNKPFQAAIKKPEFDPSAPFQTAPSESESGLRGTISGITANLDDELTGGLGAVGRVFGVKNLGSVKPFDSNSHLEMASEPLSMDEIMKAYRENRDAIRDEHKLDMATNPKATIAGNIAGSIISPVSKIAAGAKIVGPMTKMGQIGLAAKTAAMQGAAYGAGASDSDLTQGEVGQFAKDTILGAGTGAVIPYALSGAGSALKTGANLANAGGKKAFSSLFSVSEENVSKYLADPEKINNAKSIGEIKSIVDESVGKLRDAVENGKIKESDAKDALNGIKDQVTRGLSDKKIDAKDALRHAQNIFEDAKDRAIQPFKNVKAPTDRAVDVSSMVSDLKQKVMNQSSEALDALKTGDKADLSKVYKTIDESLDRLKSAGTDEADSVAAKLQDYKARLMTKHWANIDGLDAKKLIQGLDEVTTYSPMAGSFDQAKNKAFKGVRSSLDQSLKESVPAYQSAMEPVAKSAQLLESANSTFGTPELAVGKLGRLNTPRGEFDRSTLAQLENAVGKKGFITKDADAYAKAQNVLKDPQAIAKIEQSLPEYQTLRQAMADVAKRNPRFTRQQIEQATSKQRSALAEATGKRIFAENELAPFKGITEASSESKLNALMRGEEKGINNREIFQNLGDKTGKDFLQMTDDLKVKNSFEKSAINGGRNTVLGSAIGLAFGGLPGLAAGATFGHTVLDRYGPKTGKLILDGIIKLRSNPSIQTIRNLSVPESVKNELEREFKVYMIMKNSGENSMNHVAKADLKENRSPSGKQSLPTPPPGKILMQSPTGKMHYVNKSDKGEAIASGGKVVK